MDRVKFSVNGIKCSVGSEVDSDVSLNDYLRNYLNLRGTKYMCKEGGCGACVLAVTTRDAHGHSQTFSVNSCLVSVTSCHGWEVTTVEGLGDRRKGYHPVQKTLAEYNGTQCGHCSPGWVMSMFSLLEAKRYNLTQYEIENSFGSNTCRCTGYRPILDAFKSFAKDAPKPNSHVTDIEDLKLCKNKGQCEGHCEKKCESDWWFVNDSDVDDTFLKIKLKDGRIWYRALSLSDVFHIFQIEETESYMLVNGNTGKGVIPIFSYPKVLIDIRNVKEITGYYVDQNLVVGAGTTLTDLMELCKRISQEHEEFSYLQKFYEHLDLVAHIPVRNIGTIAGNLMVKHRLHTFPSDVYLLLLSVGATITIVDEHQKVTEIYIENFLALDMKGKVITQIKLPPLSSNHLFVSYKIMPRSQNAIAQVNAAFLYELRPHCKESIVKSSNIIITGLSGEFARARKTEEFLVGKKLFTNQTLQEALKVLDKELIVEEIPGALKPEYRRKCALGLFYKGLLHLIPQQTLKPVYRSGEIDLRKSRPLSNGTEVYDTNPVIYPVTEPSPKVEALIQCAGEAKYSNDLETQHGEVFCAFVTSDICTGEILEIDATPALKLPGVLAFFSAKDLPGVNTYVFALEIPGSTLSDEEIFADKIVKYYDQPIGIIVAETEKLANRAALLVNVKYKKDKETPILTIDDARKRDPSRVSLFFVIPARDRGLDVQRVIKGSDNIYTQYHYTMETIACVTKPSDFGLKVFSSTQFTDLTQIAIAKSLNINQNRVQVEVLRCGGSYGNRITRSTHIAAACSLAAYLLNRPCRFVMSIQANIRCIGKRLPSTRDFEVGVDSKGEIQYLVNDLYEDNGYVVGEPLILFTNPAIKNCYDNRRWLSKNYNVTTDTPSNTYCRSPGALEAISMIEFIMERISYELDVDPLQVRLANLDIQRTDVAEMVQTLMNDSNYNARRKEIEKFNKLNRWKKRGLRVTLMSWPSANVTAYQACLLSVYHVDGSVTFTNSGVEMGQGLNTKVIQTIAYILNIPKEKINIAAPSTVSSPNAFVNGASRTSEAICFGAIKCCQLLLDRLGVLRESLNNPTWEVLVQTAYLRGISLQTNYLVNQNDQEPYRVGGVAFSEVELDILTGEHHVTRVDLIEDVGVSLNPEIDIGQIEGAFIMGLGYWTSEHLIYDEKTGEILTDRTLYYHVPHAKDIPIDFRVQMRRNSYNPLGTLGAKAVGEPPLCLSVSVACALMESIISSREDSGYSRKEWFSVDGPFTLEANVLKADARIEEFLFN